jgi:hypothetical protein
VALPADYTVLITDKNLNVVGDPITCFTQLDITLRFNEPGASIITVPAHQWIVDQMVPSYRAVIIRNGIILMTGPLEGVLHEQADDGENGGVGMLTINSSDDLAWVAARCTYPNPAQTVAGQTSDNWTFTGNAEVGLRTLVDANAGPSALAARQVPKLKLGALASVGSNITVKATRMQPLLDLGRQMASLGGNIGFRTRQSGTDILFEVYQPTDRSGTVRFSFGLGNLKYRAYKLSAPKVTAASVGGQGAGADRAMIERTNATELASWGRYEGHVARPGSSAAQALQDDGDQALADGAATVQLSANTADTPDQRFGIEYNLGDKVALETFAGQQYADIVRTVHIQVFATSGEIVSSTVGNQAANTDPAWVAKVREIDERLGRIEQTVMPAA